MCLIQSHFVKRGENSEELQPNRLRMWEVVALKVDTRIWDSGFWIQVKGFGRFTYYIMNFSSMIYLVIVSSDSRK